ncbi:MAG: hypothetical protein KJ706_08145, partial [Candidatus Omnitrophica bacterium]|nr:hypothetical protein [Candidatus Omnitrophota bacterium]
KPAPYDAEDAAYSAWRRNQVRIYKEEDLKQTIGMTYDELIGFFAVPGLRLRGEEVLDVYGTGTVTYGAEWLARRLVFYLRNYKVYNAIKY